MIPEPLTESDLINLKYLQPEGWNDITPVFNFYLNTSFCFPVKIVIDNRIEGIGSGILFGKTGWLAHIIVALEFRNQGIGTAIVKYLLNYLFKKNCLSISLIATDLGYPIYLKEGFSVQTEYIFFERSEILKNSFSENIFQYQDKDLDSIFLLDKFVSGEERNGILGGKLERSYIFQKNGNIRGFYIPELWNGLIIADDPEAGTELMKLRCLNLTNGILPVDNIDGVEFLRKNGFKEKSRAKRMIFGERFSWHPEKIYNRIGGNLG